MENKEITASEVGKILDDMNGYVVIPLEMLERLEREAAMTEVTKAVLESSKDYAVPDLLRRIFGIRAPKEDDE